MTHCKQTGSTVCGDLLSLLLLVELLERRAFGFVTSFVFSPLRLPFRLEFRLYLDTVRVVSYVVWRLLFVASRRMSLTLSGYLIRSNYDLRACAHRTGDIISPILRRLTTEVQSPSGPLFSNHPLLEAVIILLP